MTTAGAGALHPRAGTRMIVCGPFDGKAKVFDSIKRLWALIILIVPAASGARAQGDELGRLSVTCRNEAGGPTPQQRVAACSAILVNYPMEPPQEAMIRVNRAWSYSLEKRMADAEIDYNRAIQLDPNSYVLYNERGLFRLQTGAFDAALRDYNSAVVLSPQAAYPLYGRGIVRIRMGDVARGQDDLAAARMLDRNVDAVFRVIGVTP